MLSVKQSHQTQVQEPAFVCTREGGQFRDRLERNIKQGFAAQDPVLQQKSVLEPLVFVRNVVIFHLLCFSIFFEIFRKKKTHEDFFEKIWKCSKMYTIDKKFISFHCFGPAQREFF